MVVSLEGQVSSPDELIAILGNTLLLIGPSPPPPPPLNHIRVRVNRHRNLTNYLGRGDRRRPRDI